MKRQLHFGVLVLAPALLAVCNQRFDFDVPPTDAGGATADSGATGDTGATGDADSHTASASGTTSTTGGEPDAGPGNGCNVDAECRLRSLHCNSASSQCVECLDDQHCTSSDRPHCDPELFRCVSCTTDADCAADARCDPLERRCAPSCATRQDCLDAHACNNGVCVACDRDVECREGDAAGPVCSASGLGCVSCREDAQCPQPEICDVLSGRCVVCLSSTDCDDGALCDPVLLECVAP